MVENQWCCKAFIHMIAASERLKANAAIPQDEWNRILCVHRAEPSSSCFNDQYRSREVNSAQAPKQTTAAQPLYPEGGTVVLYGNLAPDGAVIKQTAASPQLLQHRGKAYVFENYQQMRAQIDSADLPVDASTVLVM